MKLINKIHKEVREQPIYSSVYGIRIDNVELDKNDFERLLELDDKQLRGVLTSISHRFRKSQLGQRFISKSEREAVYIDMGGSDSTASSVWYNGAFIGVSTGFKNNMPESTNSIRQETRDKLQKTIDKRLQKDFDPNKQELITQITAGTEAIKVSEHLGGNNSISHIESLSNSFK